MSTKFILLLGAILLLTCGISSTWAQTTLVVKHWEHASLVWDHNGERTDYYSVECVGQDPVVVAVNDRQVPVKDVVPNPEGILTEYLCTVYAVNAGGLSGPSNELGYGLVNQADPVTSLHLEIR